MKISLKLILAKGVETAESSEQAMEQIREASRQVNAMIRNAMEPVRMQGAAIQELLKALGNVAEMSQSIFEHSFFGI